MHELDGVLEAFMDRHFAALTDHEKGRFEAILDLPDPELYAYLAGRAVAADPVDAKLLESIRQSLHPQA